MGCNCGKGKKQITNNLDNPDHIQNAKNIVESIINVKTIEDLNDLDKIEIMGAYYGLPIFKHQTISGRCNKSN